MNATSAVAYVNPRHEPDHSISVGFPVQQTYAPNHTRITRAIHLSSNEITLERMPDDGEASYMWLAFTLPGSNDEIKALGEFDFSDEMTGETIIRFKHLFPDYRKKLARYVEVHQAE